MSDTPRTDEVAYTIVLRSIAMERVPADFARQLERELADARGWLHHYEKGDASVWSALKKENAELKAEIEAMRPVVEAAKMCDQSCCLDPDDLYLLRKRVAEYEASRKEIDCLKSGREPGQAPLP